MDVKLKPCTFEPNFTVVGTLLRQSTCIPVIYIPATRIHLTVYKNVFTLLHITFFLS